MPHHHHNPHHVLTFDAPRPDPAVDAIARRLAERTAVDALYDHFVAGALAEPPPEPPPVMAVSRAIVRCVAKRAGKTIDGHQAALDWVITRDQLLARLADQGRVLNGAQIVELYHCYRAERGLPVA